MNDHFQDQDFCYHHPIQPLVGVCPFCLNERLLSVAAKQRRRSHHRHLEEAEEGVPRPSHSRKPSTAGLPKIFAFGSLLNRLELIHLPNRRGTSDCDEHAGGASDSHSTSTSLEDSFISMKLEDNGVALWDKSNVSKAEDQGINRCDAPTNTIAHKGLHKEGNGKRCRDKSVVEHTKTPRGSLRWRKRIGHLFHLVRWKKRSSKPNGAASHHVNGASGTVKVRNRGWIRRRASKESREA